MTNQTAPVEQDDAATFVTVPELSPAVAVAAATAGALKPIIFSAPMVRAILSGAKTQTRRLLKPQPDFLGGRGMEKDLSCWGWQEGDRPGYVVLKADSNDGLQRQYRPRWSVGDRLWVRETFSGQAAPLEAPCPPIEWNHTWPIWYWADGNPPSGDWERPRPSIHMPRWASRITLEVTDVRVQRLHEISEEDAMAEGAFKEKATGRVFNNVTEMRLGGPEWKNARDWFADMWEHIHGPTEWLVRPWVCALTFKRVE